MGWVIQRGEEKEGTRVTKDDAVDPEEKGAVEGNGMGKALTCPRLERNFVM